MAHFELKVTIGSLNDEQAKEIMEKYPDSSLYARWSYDGTMIRLDSLEEFDMLDDDEYAEKRLNEGFL